MKLDLLYRVSLKCLVTNHEGEVLVVKESGRENWDLPGGGMEHGESVATAIARELHEEVGYQGKFNYNVIQIDEPFRLLTRDVWQMRIVLKVTPQSIEFSAGADADDMKFVDPAEFKNSEIELERKIYEYANSL